MAESLKVESLDGRRLRSQRSKAAIIDAALGLMTDGILVPTAQQISKRAGVGMRTFFRHFEDMESLFEAADARARSSYEAPFMGGNRDGSVAERVEHAVAQRAAAYESIKNMMLSTQAQLWRSEHLRKNYARAQRSLRKDLENWLPEVKDLPQDRREAIDAIASFEMWHRLREHQRLSKKACIKIVVGMLAQQIL